MLSNLAVNTGIDDHGFIEIIVVCYIRTFNEIRIVSEPEFLNNVYCNDLLIIFQMEVIRVFVK